MAECRIWGQAPSTHVSTLLVGLSGILVLSRAELTGGSGLLLKLLLLLAVGVADLNRVFLAMGWDRVVVELLDDVLASVA